MKIKLPKMTLIEWLIVIAIIGILASLFFGGGIRFDGLSQLFDSGVNLD